MKTDDDAVLAEILREQGCSEEETEQILEKLQLYDNRMIRESVFASIASGSFNLMSIIQEVKNSQS